jgi:hypothetical protein
MHRQNRVGPTQHAEFAMYTGNMKASKCLRRSILALKTAPQDNLFGATPNATFCMVLSGTSRTAAIDVYSRPDSRDAYIRNRQ